MIRTDKLISEMSNKIAGALDVDEDSIKKFLDSVNKQGLFYAQTEKNWKYPWMGADQKSCPMLDAMFHIEHRKGVILFIPFETTEQKP